MWLLNELSASPSINHVLLIFDRTMLSCIRLSGRGSTTFKTPSFPMSDSEVAAGSLMRTAGILSPPTTCPYTSTPSLTRMTTSRALTVIKSRSVFEKTQYIKSLPSPRHQFLISHLPLSCRVLLHFLPTRTA